MGMSKADKIHKTLWKAQERLAQDRQVLTALERERVRELAGEALGEQTVDAGLARKLEALRTQVQEEDHVLSELCSRHRAALADLRTEEAARAQKEHAAMEVQRQEAETAYMKALGQLTLLGAEVERLKFASFAPVNMGPARGPGVIEGTAGEVLDQAKTTAAFAVDPRSLTEALARLEDQQRREGFPGGNVVIKREGKTYIPCPGRVHIDFDPETGQVADGSRILSTLAVEARLETGVLVAIEDAVPVAISELDDSEKIATSFAQFNPAQPFSVPAAPDSLNVNRDVRGPGGRLG
jgi:hypothetical protein